MTHPSKRKGVRFETEIVKLARAHNLRAERAWGSDGRALGMHPEVDLLIENFKIQAKRRKKLPDWLTYPHPQVEAVIVRQDRQPAQILMPLSDWLELVRLARTGEAAS